MFSISLLRNHVGSVTSLTGAMGMYQSSVVLQPVGVAKGTFAIGTVLVVGACMTIDESSMRR